MGLLVNDNRIGIEEQYKDSIFEVFKRLHIIDEYKGNEIGLSVAQRIVERHGGHIWGNQNLVWVLLFILLFQ